MIFSDNANELESKLHKQLHDNRVNKINLRKEFFRTTIDELEELVYSLEPSAIFNKTMLAEQYYQSMAVNEIPDSVSIIDDDGADIEKLEKTHDGDFYLTGHSNRWGHEKHYHGQEMEAATINGYNVDSVEFFQGIIDNMEEVKKILKNTPENLASEALNP
jgi:hypothetical protein